MPELTFTTRWPDGRSLQTYSPSLVVHDHLQAGASYEVADFVDRATTALTQASDRVEARWGRPCTAARASMDTIRLAAADQPEGLVTVVAFDPPAHPFTGSAS
ncbi:MSMEG_0570 family nitrogen starvation response protein [Microlunatus antarcticus]|uniref:Putative repeat protein (TIGR04042 family) n=1 Tax=Microlunatus antarcticus TaxID=53388 RepID=A0A7W5JV08_9ACTN|nr:MSMEG_0570 family nitrogen starvation response protein [Microlunatus antarcticus]MBB3326806.1 putative repeat protein (TIGR04042 family) [Microlunatus antarcticus]